MTDTNLFNNQITDTLAGARIGMWCIIREGDVSNLYVDFTAAELVGNEEKLSPEELFNYLIGHVAPEHLYKFAEYDASMTAGQRAEIVYPYHHPKRGTITIRCGGMLDKTYNGPGIRFRGYHQEITEYTDIINEKTKHLDEAIEKGKYEHEVLESVARIYNSMHLIDFEKNTFTELNSIPVLSHYIQNNIEESMQDILWGFMKTTICPNYLERMIEFTDFSTLEKRLEYKTDISIEVKNHANNWWGFKFIRAGEIEKSLKKVLFVSKDINESKQREESLREISNTDELTRVMNRHAYENAVKELEKSELPCDLRVIAIDLNGLKIANDTMGHEAGDELLVATAECCSRAVREYGSLYRVGGDEFTAIINCDDTELIEILVDMDSRMKKWRGRFSERFSFSKGVASAHEFPGASMQDLEKTADHRMYMDKKLYYSGQNNRRKQR